MDFLTLVLVIKQLCYRCLAFVPTLPTKLRIVQGLPLRQLTRLPVDVASRERRSRLAVLRLSQAAVLERVVCGRLALGGCDRRVHDLLSNLVAVWVRMNLCRWLHRLQLLCASRTGLMQAHAALDRLDSLLQLQLALLRLKFELL